MISSVIENEKATVRVHDEYCRKDAQRDLKEIGRIVSRAYHSWARGKRITGINE